MKTKQPPMNIKSSDDFQTPDEAVNIIIPYLKKDWMIWEPASGNGNICRCLNKNGFNVINTDIKSGADFLNFKPDKFDCIITNPPYSIKVKFIKRCYDLYKPFALLMPLTALESEKRQALWRGHNLQLLIPNKRFHFETPNGKKSSSWFATAWFCFNMNLPKDITFVNMQNNKQKIQKNNSKLHKKSTATEKVDLGSKPSIERFI